MSKQIPVLWFKNLPEKEQEDFKSLLRSNFRTLDRLRQMLRDDLKALEALEENDDTYSNGYPFTQAFYNGRRRELKHILSYLSFLED